MPAIVKNSITILSDAGLGMAMFSLGEFFSSQCNLSIFKLTSACSAVLQQFLCCGAGLFMALQPKIIACGNTVAAVTMAIRFFLGPAVMAATSAAVGLRGTLLRVAVVQVRTRGP